MDEGILYNELIKILERKVYGRSISYPKGWVNTKDILDVANDIISGRIDKFGNIKSTDLNEFTTRQLEYEIKRRKE